MSLPVIAAIAAAGAAGAVSRFLLTELVRTWCGTFPLSTFVVNAIGCLLFGLCYELAQGGHGNERWAPVVQAAVLTGFLGAFTTFSAFAFDCAELIEQRRWLAMGAYLVGQNALGVLAIWCGSAMATAMRVAA